MLSGERGGLRSHGLLVAPGRKDAGAPQGRPEAEGPLRRRRNRCPAHQPHGLRNTQMLGQGWVLRCLLGQIPQELPAVRPQADRQRVHLVVQALLADSEIKEDSTAAPR